MQEVYHQDFIKQKEAIKNSILNFDKDGNEFINGKRNKIKLFVLDKITVNVKSFKVPNLINQIVYAYFRPSKARRSYEFANILLEKGILTPQPIAYIENFTIFGLEKSYYISEHLNCDLTYRELVENPDFPDHENILRQFTKFSYDLHEKGVEFLDHSPGNTLIVKKSESKYDFYLVDLNRMKFHNQLDFHSRMKNLSKITPKKEMVAVMSNEYARLSGLNEQKVFATMWQLTQEFQYRFYRKKKIKRVLKFWKKR
ncbi:Kdo domain containing protein [Flavobacterium flavigenum]|uniref:Kdo domain containing protein n=1 Tax=Flavobacterium flavigenum TaxID=3003258 RepID=UPI0022ABD0DD|nr:Kdo domain containing protein [Flavobacterium flavigenum]